MFQRRWKMNFKLLDKDMKLFVLINKNTNRGPYSSIA